MHAAVIVYWHANSATEELARALLANKPGGLCKAIFVNSGSEATDAALKLAVQYWHEKGQPQRTRFIARKQSYHGNTIGALCVSGHESRRAFNQDFMSSNVSFVDPCYAYRMKDDQETDEEFVARLAQQFENEILRLGPENVAGFVAETVSGTTLGCAPAVPGYFRAIRDICDRYGVLLILDEVRPAFFIIAFVTKTHLTLAIDHVWNGQNRHHACMGAGRHPRSRHPDNRQSPRCGLCTSFWRSATREDL